MKNEILNEWYDNWRRWPCGRLDGFEEVSELVTCTNRCQVQVGDNGLFGMVYKTWINSTAGFVGA